MLLVIAYFPFDVLLRYFNFDYVNRIMRKVQVKNVETYQYTKIVHKFEKTENTFNKKHVNTNT